MFLLSSKLLVSLALLIIIAVTDADANRKCNAGWKAYGFDESLNDMRRNEVQKVILQKQGIVEYTCEHEQIAAKIRDEVVKDDPTFTYGIDLVFAAKKKFKILEEVTIFPEGMLEDKLQEIDIVASSFGCARSDGTVKPPEPIKPSIKPKPPKKTKNKKKNPKKNKKTGKKSRHKRSAAKMPAKTVKVQNTKKKGKNKPNGNKVKKGGIKKGKNKKKGPQTRVKPPAFIAKPLPPLKAVYFVCVYKLNSSRTR